MIDLYALRDSRGRELPAGHPVPALLAELPWLHKLGSVRELFQLIVILYRDRVTIAIEAGLHDGSAIAHPERELLFLHNLTEDICISGRTANLPERFRAARREIADLGKRLGASETAARHLARFDRAVAELMRAVRLCREGRQASPSRTYRDASVVTLRPRDAA